MGRVIRFEELLFYEITENELLGLFNKGKNILWGMKSDYGIYYKPFSKCDELGNAIIKHIKEYNKCLDFAIDYKIKIEPCYCYFVQI